MNNEKVKLGIYQHIPELLKTVKASAICAEAGMTIQLFNNKLHHTANSKYSVRKFSQSDVELINNGIWALAEKLSVVSIEYSENRQGVIDQIKNRLSGIFLKSVAVNKMGWTETKFKSCMVKTSSKGRYMTFTEADIQQLILSVREIAMRMLSIEYYLAQE